MSGQLTISVGEQSKVTIGRGFAKVPKGKSSEYNTNIFFVYRKIELRIQSNLSFFPGSCFELNNPGRHSAIVCFFLATT